MQITAILLAAGEAKRFGANKLLHLYRGKSLYEHALNALCDAPAITEIIMVVNEHFRSTIHDPYPKGHKRSTFLKYVLNPDYRQGMGTSLREGVKASSANADAYLIALADMPRVSAKLIGALISFYQQSDKAILIPQCGDRRGHPVIMSSLFREALSSLSNDQGARQVISEHSHDVGYFVTEDDAVLFDVDLRSDLGQ